MRMKLGVNYSHATRDLCQQNSITVDVFKCPAWPDLVAEAQEYGAVYVHFPLQIGRGQTGVIDSETRQTPDWDKFEQLMRQTDTPYVNLHPALTLEEYAHIPPQSTADIHLEEVLENLVRDVTAVCDRFGAERVIVENIPDTWGQQLLLNAHPPLYHALIAATGCGFLLDLSHAWLAAWRLGQEPREYVSALPLDHIREIHTTGIQRIEGKWIALAKEFFPPHMIAPMSGQFMDHLPYREEDWPFVSWAMNEIHCGNWTRPWVTSLEFGGVGGVWEAVADRDTLREQVPHLYSLVHPLPQNQKSR